MMTHLFNLETWSYEYGDEIFSPTYTLIIELFDMDLGLVRGMHFGSGRSWPEAAWPKLFTFPIISGFLTGFAGSYIQSRWNVQLDMDQKWKFVVGLGNHFLFAHKDLEFTFYMGQKTFQFGMDLGAKDFSLCWSPKSGFKREIPLLATILHTFLEYPDDQTLKLNLEIFCRMHDLECPPQAALANIIDRWNDQKKYYLAKE